MTYTFDNAKIESKNIFLDGIGYKRVSDLLYMRHMEYKDLYRRVIKYRYSINGWKNADNSLADALNLANIKNSVVLDFGSGFGLEALLLAKNGNKVIVSDIIDGGVQLAMKSLRIHGYEPHKRILIQGNAPYFQELDESIDVFLAVQSLNYNPNVSAIMTEIKNYFKPGAVAYLMAPSTGGWNKATNNATEPAGAIDADPNYPLFKNFFAPFSTYVDYYSTDKATTYFGSTFGSITNTEVSADNRYGVTRLSI